MSPSHAGDDETIRELRLALTRLIDDALQRAGGDGIRSSAQLMDVLLDLRRDLVDALEIQGILAATE